MSMHLYRLFVLDRTSGVRLHATRVVGHDGSAAR
eukprot:COSAG02_NODE_2399_length_8948_cov_21.873771_2_plen_34_part_00